MQTQAFGDDSIPESSLASVQSGSFSNSGVFLPSYLFIRFCILLLCLLELDVIDLDAEQRVAECRVVGKDITGRHLGPLPVLCQHTNLKDNTVTEQRFRLCRQTGSLLVSF
eukprot:GHUV01032795.1.p2 GENE.GHUV01032795.1~~GHUV01032795.1.p2  ORF type:complete len:111 (+),score=6.90 GHUV01032795.1:1292-1624(+)